MWGVVTVVAALFCVCVVRERSFPGVGVTVSACESVGGLCGAVSGCERLSGSECRCGCETARVAFLVSEGACSGSVVVSVISFEWRWVWGCAEAVTFGGVWLVGILG